MKIKKYRSTYGYFRVYWWDFETMPQNTDLFKHSGWPALDWQNNQMYPFTSMSPDVDMWRVWCLEMALSSLGAGRPPTRGIRLFHLRSTGLVAFLQWYNLMTQKYGLQAHCSMDTYNLCTAPISLILALCIGNLLGHPCYRPMMHSRVRYMTWHRGLSYDVMVTVIVYRYIINIKIFTFSIFYSIMRYLEI